MAKTTLEELARRVDELEKTVNELKRARAASGKVKDWRRTIGMFAGDEVMKEIFELGRKIREADRKKARK
jgi:hypothetical protein